MGQYKVLISFLNNQTRVYTCRVKSTILVPLDLSGFRGGLYCTSEGACCSSTVQLTISHCYSWGGGVSSLSEGACCSSTVQLTISHCYSWGGGVSLLLQYCRADYQSLLQLGRGGVSSLLQYCTADYQSLLQLGRGG